MDFPSLQQAAALAMMNIQQRKQADALAALTAADRERLLRLAQLENTTPEQLWPDVWLYGFDDVEEGIRADLQADKEIAEGKTIPNEDVMAGLQRMFDHVEPKRYVG
ncbi:hypothetical protein J2X54_004357 [Duganella sp. 3397]|uniref:hypothetical protein n=1 Tax=Duganella TaxID=75654 RepID=UPI001E410885|nr:MULTISPECIES: hypothetical protein [Duganella]MDR7051856.1 hypothetical protein [Duganella sp. 3397]